MGLGSFADNLTASNGVTTNMTSGSYCLSSHVSPWLSVFSSSADKATKALDSKGSLQCAYVNIIT